TAPSSSPGANPVPDRTPDLPCRAEPLAPAIASLVQTARTGAGARHIHGTPWGARMPAQKSEAIRSVAIAAAAVHSIGAQARDLLHAAAANTHEQACRLRRAADAEHLRATTAAATAATLRIRTHATTAANAATELLDRGYLALEVLHVESGPTVPMVTPGHGDPAGGVIALLL